MTETAAALAEHPGHSTERLLIVFTDEVGSTALDRELFDGLGKEPSKYREALIARRSAQFGRVIKSLSLTGSRVVKNVGDSLLITRLGHGGDFVPSIAALFSAWNGLASKIRVAVHLEERERIATDTDLDRFVELLLAASSMAQDELSRLWPAIASIKHDVFGSAINFAARLAGLAKGAEFVVSEEVAHAVSRKVVSTKSLRGDYEIVLDGAQRLSSEIDCDFSLLPVAHVKGFDLSVDRPSWVVELRPHNTGSTLLKQFKSVSALRLLEVSPRPGTPLARARTQASERIQASLRLSPAIDFYVDMKFDAIASWNGLPINRDRTFTRNPQNPFVRRDTLQRATSNVILSSCPDLETDQKIRDTVRLESKGKNDNWIIIPLTFRIHEEPTYVPDRLTPGSEYFLLEFQVDANAPDPVLPDARAAVFRLLGDELIDDFPVVASGLVEGETDGFVLFQGDGRDADKVLELIWDAGLPRGINGGTHFLRTVGTVAVHQLRLSSVQNDNAVLNIFNANAAN